MSRITEQEYDVQVIKWTPTVHTYRVKSQNVTHARQEVAQLVRQGYECKDPHQPKALGFRTTVMFSKKVR